MHPDHGLLLTDQRQHSLRHAPRAARLACERHTASVRGARCAVRSNRERLARRCHHAAWYAAIVAPRPGVAVTEQVRAGTTYPCPLQSVSPGL